MSARFLNERLVTTERFGPKEKPLVLPDDRRPVETQAAGPATDVQDLIRAESEKLKQNAISADLAETYRRRDEVLSRLRDVLGALEREQEEIAGRLTLLQQKRDALESLRASDGARADLSTLRQLRQEVQGTHIELVKIERERAEDREEGFRLLSLTFGQLTRLGIGLSWPVIVALLAAAAMIVAGLFLAFGT